MATIGVAIDNIHGKGSDRRTLDEFIAVLKEAGHNVQDRGVGPNGIQRASGTASVDVMVQIAGGICIGTASDFVYGIHQGYYHAKKMALVFMECARDPETYKFNGLAWDDNFSRGNQRKLALSYTGKCYKDFASDTHNILGFDNTQLVIYPPGRYKTGTDAGKAFLQALNGGVATNAGANAGGGSSGGSVFEKIKEVCNDWNELGIDMLLDGNTLHIQRTTTNDAREMQYTVIGNDTVTLEDFDNTTVNIVETTVKIPKKDKKGKVMKDKKGKVVYVKKKLKLEQKDLVDRYGENKKKLIVGEHEITKMKTETVTTPSSTDTTGTDTGTDTTTDSSTDTSSTDTSTDTSTDITDTSGTGTGTETTQTITKKEKVTIKDPPDWTIPDEVKIRDRFQLLKRGHGHSIDCKCLINQEFTVNKWVHLKIPLFNIDDYYYITKSTFDNDVFLSLTLEPAPPDRHVELSESTSTSTANTAGVPVNVHGNDCSNNKYESNAWSGHRCSPPKCMNVGKTIRGNSDRQYAKETAQHNGSCKELVEYVQSQCKYLKYADNKFGSSKCPEALWTGDRPIRGNCADYARMLKCILDVNGYKSIICHIPNHFFNAVWIDNQWVVCDLCRVLYGDSAYGNANHQDEMAVKPVGTWDNPVG